MKLIRFLLALLLTTALVYALNRSYEGTSPIPPMGHLLSPFHGFWQNAEALNAPIEKEIKINALNEPVTVVFDDRMVPHIFAQNMEDACFVQGYLLAKDRLWQMDIATRSISGRLAEVMGPSLLKRDQLQRRKGLVFAAENALKSWKKSPKEFQFVEAYTAGVNEYINQLLPKDYPIEFKLLNYQPEAWTHLKSALFIKSMALNLASRESDLESSNALNLLGRKLFDFLFPGRNPLNDPIIPKEVEWDFDPLAIEEPATEELSSDLILHPSIEKVPPNLGSNNWAVGGDKTASGYPILCNDPHLMLTLPAIWYELQIKLPEFNCYGVCLPGFPGITIGFNEHIAWGMTNVQHDILDWYKIKWVDAQKEMYWLDNEKVAVDKKIETYLLKDGTKVQDTVKYTVWGPIVYKGNEHAKADLAMRWLAHDPIGNELKTFYQLNSAKNHSDYLKAIDHFVVPAQNIVFASQEGDIAITVSGQLPLKSQEQGRYVQNGDKKSNGWKGFIPFEHNPAVKNPSRAFVASANQCSTDETYPYYYNSPRDGFEDYRGRILNQKLSQMDQITVDHMRALQNDVYGLRAAESLPLLLSHIETEQLSPEALQYLDILKNWDYEYHKDAKAPILYTEWFRSFYKNTWDEFYQYEDSLSLLYPRYWRTIALLKDQPDHQLFDQTATPEVEQATDIVQMSFEEMNEKVAEALKKEDSLEWHRQRNSRIYHMGRIPAFHSKPLPVGGDSQTLNAINSWGAGPSWRMIVAFGPDKKAYGVYPGGQSGNPGSPYYDNMIDQWAKGELYELLFLKDEKETHQRILGQQVFGR